MANELGGTIPHCGGYQELQFIPYQPPADGSASEIDFSPLYETLPSFLDECSGAALEKQRIVSGSLFFLSDQGYSPTYAS